MFGSWAMPVWYKNLRLPLMFCQILLAALIQTYGMPRRKHYYVRLCLWAVLGYGIVYLCYHDGKFYIDYILVNFVLYAATMAGAWLCNNITLCTAALAAANAYLMEEMAGAVKSILRILFPALVDMAFDPIGILVLDCMSYGVVYLIMFLLLRKKVRQTDYLREHYKVFAAVLAVIICIVMTSMTRGHDPSSEGFGPSLADNLYLIGSGALLLALQVGLAGQLKAVQDVNTMKQVIREQHLQYKTSKETAELLNEKYHDLKQIIGSLHGRITPEELEALDKSVSAYGSYLHTGSEVLDVLLTEKQMLCEKNGIRITTMVDGADLNFAETLDLYTLFSNAITNAIRAVSRLPEGRERFITLSVSRTGNMVLIHMENPCEDNLTFRDGLPMTARDERYHGFGMKSMERVAEKYGGSLAAAKEGNMFSLDILLLDPGVKKEE